MSYFECRVDAKSTIYNNIVIIVASYYFSFGGISKGECNRARVFQRVVLILRQVILLPCGVSTSRSKEYSP
jgi:hypothetical protein